MSPFNRPPITDMAPGQGDTSPRELRAQMVQRLQVGLFGLSLMLLLVGLANIIMEQARRNDANLAQSSVAISSGAMAGQGAGDPLADIGVVPSPDAGSAKRVNGRGPAK
jgi:hypothetical protein